MFTCGYLWGTTELYVTGGKTEGLAKGTPFKRTDQDPSQAFHLCLTGYLWLDHQLADQASEQLKVNHILGHHPALAKSPGWSGVFLPQCLRTVKEWAISMRTSSWPYTH